MNHSDDYEGCSIQEEEVIGKTVANEILQTIRLDVW